MTRRDRRRLATYEEIISVSRDLLRAGSAASLRNIATEMGMTSSALYRYVESVDDLHSLIARSVYEDVIAAMAGAAEPYADDPTAQLAASATAFRLWGLHNTAEFKMIFAGLLSGQSGKGGPSHDVSRAAQDGSELFADYFVAIFVRLAEEDMIRMPDLNNLDDSMQDLLANRTRATDQALVDLLGPDGPSLLWLFQLAWARLYGVVILEVFGLVDRAMIESGALFTVLMRETFDSLGLPDEWDRLRAVSLKTSVRQPGR